jgi:transposase
MIRLSDVKVRLQYRWRVRQRLMVLHFARLHGSAAAGRRYGVTARTIRRWRVRWRQGGLEGLVPRYPRRRGRRVTARVIELVEQARRELEYGAQRTQLWPRRVHDVRIAVGAIQRVFRDMGCPRLRRTRKRAPRQMKLFEKAEPGPATGNLHKFEARAKRRSHNCMSPARRRCTARWG